LPYARPAWTKISGGCPVMALPGSALTVETGTDLGISNFSYKR
jgi:hypothetical protein